MSITTEIPEHTVRSFTAENVTIKSILIRRARIWLPTAVGLFLLFLLAGFFIVPQSYSATTSLSMQSSTMPSAAAALLGGAAGPRKYIGVLKSRSMAEEVDRSVGFREMLGLPPTAEGQTMAIDKVVHDLRVDDNVADGLLYITVNLSGPPKMGRDPEGRKQRLPAAAALAANRYADALRRFLRDSDTDKEQVLLKSGQVQVRDAERDYMRKLDALGDYIKQHRDIVAVAATRVPSPSLQSAGSPSTESSPEQAELGALYLTRNALRRQIASLDTLAARTRSFLTANGDRIDSMPAEDPLLLQSRRQVTEAAQRLKNLQITYGNAKPEVRQAMEQLKIAQDHLHNQVQSILHGETSDQIKRVALQAEYDTVLQQILISERDLYRSRKEGFALTRLQYDVQIALDVLRAKLSKYAEMQVQTVSAQSRMAVVDVARPPLHPSPGIAMIIAFSAAMAAAAVGLMLLIEYQRMQTKTGSAAE